MNRIVKNIVYHAPWLLSDRKYIEYFWELRMGTPLDLDHPRSFNEKLQWLKLNDRKPEYTKMADKAAVKDYVAGIIGPEHIIPTIGVYDKVSDIPWDKLPDQFVLKCSHDSGSVAVCRDKSVFDREKTCRQLKKNLRTNHFYRCREWCYKGIKPRILCEKYMSDGTQANGLVDYKFFCFNGKPEFLYVSQGLEDHSTARISFADMDGNRLQAERSDYRGFEGGIPIPSHFDEMKVIAGTLANSVGNRFVRVDLYEINGIIYFSELTFYPNGGMIPFAPDKDTDWDLHFGKLIEL